MGSYREVLDLEEMRSAIKMIKRMERERVKESGKYGVTGEKKIRDKSGVAGYSKLFHNICLNYTK